MELLAPAGNLEAFFAALDNGADAVYVGLKGFSARAYAPNFGWPELSAMAGVCRQRGKKLYVALNALVKEGERGELIDTLAGLSEIRPAALITQDLGVAYLVRHHFPDLRLHASTLMTLHNSLGVAQAAAMGFSRVVLARELTLPELALIKRQSTVELEIFVHGALCYCISGLCLFSCFLGGRGATRGRCTQPCRRQYKYKDTQGFPLSASDVSALELLPQLKAMGIDALKIEGRMKAGEYVGRVVRAYRLMLAAGPLEQAQALEEARGLLARTYSRRTTPGFFLSSSPREILAPEDSGNIGEKAGVLAAATEGRGTIRLEAALEVGDRLRLQEAATGKAHTFTLKQMWRRGHEADDAVAGEAVELGLPVTPQGGELLYKVGETTPESSRSERKWREILYQEAEPTMNGPGPLPAAWERLKTPERQRPGAKIGRPYYTFQARTYEEAKDLAQQRLGNIVVELTEANYADFLATHRHRGTLPRLVWQLPEIIFEKQVGRYRQAVQTLREAGFRFFMVSNLGHLALLQAAAESKPGKFAASPDVKISRGKEKGPEGTKGPELVLWSDYALHCLNAYAFAALSELGVSRMTLSVEADRETLKLLVGHLPPERLMVYLYAFLPLMISRVPLPGGEQSLRLESSHLERFRLLRQGELTLLLASQPLFFGKASEELLRRGVRNFIIDLRHSGVPRRELPALLKDIEAGRVKPASAGNYFRGLQ